MFCPVFREEWKVVTNPSIKANMYSISNVGRIKNNITGLILKEQVINSGYLVVSLRCEDVPARKFLIHRLVAEEFVENDSPLRNTVNHKDGNKLLDHYYNLEWNTQGENNRHARLNGLNNAYAESHYSAKLTNYQVRSICEMLTENYTYGKILETIGLDPSNSNNHDLIGNIKRRIAWTSISKDYDFSQRDIKTTFRRFTVGEVESMCKCLEDGISVNVACEQITGEKYLDSKRNKRFYEFYRELKNRTICPEISNRYNF